MDTHERFIRDTKNHRLTVQLDQGYHRHITLARPGSSAYHFNIVTWPGYLSITGDMESYTFSRVRDMFEFFRDPEMLNRVNCRYWHEKAVAVDRESGPKVFSESRFKKAVQEDANDWEVRLGDAEKIQREIDAELINYGHSSIHEAHEAASNFEASDGNVFTDFWEHDLTEYSFHFTWSLKAIVWGIKQYDLLKEGRTQADHDAKVLAGTL